MAVEAYSVLDLEFNPHLKLDRGHTITIVIHDGENRTRDELYIDGYHIHPSNWSYNSRCYKTDRTTIRYLQRPMERQHVKLAGTVSIDTKRTTGCGKMKFDSADRGVHLERISNESSALPIVGRYNLHYNKLNIGEVNIHPKAMNIGGEKVESFEVKGNCVSWKGSNKEGHVKENGFLEFSDDGRHIIKSSLGAVGSKILCRMPRARVMRSSSSLDETELINMDPFDGNGADTVQQKSMDDFYLLVKYFMNEDWRKSFLQYNPVVLDGYLQDIANDDEKSPDSKLGDNIDYYQTLSVPYLTYALSNADHDDAKKLNYIRADKTLKSLTKESHSKVYNRHTGDIYTYHWKDKFPAINDFLKDQANTDYKSKINSLRDQWKEEVEEGQGDALGSDLIAITQQDINEYAQKAIENKAYWAFVLFHKFAHPDYLNQLKFIMTSTPTLIDDIQRDHERYCSVMTVLDPSNYFTQKFSMVLQLFQMTILIPGEVDISNLDDLSFFAERIIDKFIDMYTNSPDPALAEAAQALRDAAEEFTKQELINAMTDTAKVSMTWGDFFSNLNRECLKKFAKFSSGVASALSMFGFGYALQTIASGVVNWEDLNTTEQAEFVVACTRGAASLIKNGADFIYYAPRMWEKAKAIFYKAKDAIANVMEIMNSLITKQMIKKGFSKAGQKLTVVEEVADGAIVKAFSKFRKLAGKLSKFISTRVAGVLALAGVVFSAIDLANSKTPIEKAMNTMFLLSSILEVVAVAADIAISMGLTTIGGAAIGFTVALTTIASVVGALAIVAAIIGLIVMLVMMFQPQEPPDPVKDFIEGDDVRNAGFYMPLDTTIEYFAVQMDDDEESKQLGVTFTTDGRNYMHMDIVGNITFTAVDQSYHTVFTVGNDVVGVTSIYTKAINGEEENIFHLTANDDNSVNMQNKFSDETERQKQLWIVNIIGSVTRIGNDQLESAVFTICNKKSGKYLYSNGKNISASSTAQYWTIKLEYMKPAVLSMDNIHLTNYNKNRTFHPYLAQSGSTSGRVFTISPRLPDWLEFDTKSGTISQKPGTFPIISPPTPYTLSVSNPQGKANSAEFTIEVVDAEQEEDLK